MDALEHTMLPMSGYLTEVATTLFSPEDKSPENPLKVIDLFSAALPLVNTGALSSGRVQFQIRLAENES